MINNTTKRPAKSRLVLSVVAALALTAMAGSASAVPAVNAIGGPVQVEYPGFFMIQYQAINYAANTTTQSCAAGSTQSSVPAASIDTIRFWNSLAQAALLAGKNMTIYYYDCIQGGVTNKYLNDLVLVK